MGTTLCPEPSISSNRWGGFLFGRILGDAGCRMLEKQAIKDCEFAKGGGPVRVFFLDRGGPGLDKILAWLSGKKNIREVSVIKDPDLFLEQVEWEKPDLVMIRLGDSDIPGLNIGRMVKALEPEIRIVFVSDERVYALDAYEVGAYGYLLSPITETKLRKIFSSRKKELKQPVPPQHL